MLTRILRKCVKSQRSNEFFKLLENCLNEDTSLDLQLMTENLTYQFKHYITGTEIIFENESVTLDQKQEEISWSLIFHYKFGPCFSLNTESIDVLSKNMVAKKIEFALNKYFPWSDVVMILYERGKFSNDWLYQSWTYLENILPYKEYFVLIKRKIIEKQPTRRNGCVETPISVCKELLLKSELKEKHKCDVLLMKTEQKSNSSPDCNNNVTLCALQKWRIGYSDSVCPDLPICYHESYPLIQTSSKTNNGPKIVLAYKDPIIEHHLSYISYNAQSLIGEIGGTLGLTLGLSGLSVLDVITSFINRFIR